MIDLVVVVVVVLILVVDFIGRFEQLHANFHGSYRVDTSPSIILVPNSIRSSPALVGARYMLNRRLRLFLAKGRRRTASNALINVAVQPPAATAQEACQSNTRAPHQLSPLRRCTGSSEEQQQAHRTAATATQSS